ncbi:MAG: Activator of Hsp90 ATPase 1-like protein [Solirubrobacteraceae bacterium]|jgi:carbon monoxide dehydrogenase subunit G|nr:Activator of Hsp90 ATPase 1-like protein [Solirubrobacteraceae bacterium]
MRRGPPGHKILAMSSTWTASALSCAPPEAVLAALTDPDAVASWSPVAFELEDESGRLRAGTRTRVSGKLAGVRVGFDVEVHRADDRQLALSARGPVNMDVNYDVAPAPDGSTTVRASVSVVKGRGLVAGLLAEATAGLLRGGALAHAVNRIAATA